MLSALHPTPITFKGQGSGTLNLLCIQVGVWNFGSRATVLGRDLSGAAKGQGYLQSDLFFRMQPAPAFSLGHFGFGGWVLYNV